MSRPRLFLIKFDNQTGIFHNGQALSGHVYLENEEELEIDGEYHFLCRPNYPPFQASCLSSALRGTAFLDEWLSPGHFLYLMLQTVAGYQL